MELKPNSTSPHTCPSDELNALLARNTGRLELPRNQYTRQIPGHHSHRDRSRVRRRPGRLPSQSRQRPQRPQMSAPGPLSGSAMSRDRRSQKRSAGSHRFSPRPAKVHSPGRDAAQRHSAHWPSRHRQNDARQSHCGEANANFFSASGSDFTEIYVGVGARRIRELFRSARKPNLPSSSSTRSIVWAKTASSIRTANCSRPTTPSSPPWTASTPPKASSSSRPPIAPKIWMRPSSPGPLRSQGLRPPARRQGPPRHSYQPIAEETPMSARDEAART